MATPKKSIKVKQPPVMFNQTQKLIQEVQSKTNAKVICYWMSSRGSICNDDVNVLHELLEIVGPQENVFMFIKSNGGNVQAALRIVHLLRHYSKNLTALIPLEAASSATLISLGADNIHMGPLAYLTAIDSSLTHDLSPLDRDNRRVSVSQDELMRIRRLWNESALEHHGNPYTDMFKYIHPLVIGALDRSSSLSIKICQEILSYHITDKEKAEKLSKHLNYDYPSHSYPITYKEADRLGLKVSQLDAELNSLLFDLNHIYSEMAQPALTDFDETNYHDNEILNIIESDSIQFHYQNDKDWNYIKEERRWQSLNNESCWRKVELVGGKEKIDKFHVA